MKKANNPFQRGNTWTYILYVRDPATGKKKQKWVGGFKTKKEATEELRKKEAQIELGTYDVYEGLSTRDYLLDWFENVHKPNLKPSTARGYSVNIRNHILPYIGNVPIKSLSRNDITKLYNTLLAKGLSPTSVKYVHHVLSKALNDALASDLIAKNPCLYASVPKQQRYRAVVLNNEQSQRLLQTASTTDIYLELLFAMCLGLRRGEVLGLKFSDFDFYTGTVHIQRQITVTDDGCEFGISTLKTEESDRVLYVPAHLLDIVKARQKECKEDKIRHGKQYNNLGFVCCDEFGNYKNPYTLYRKYKRLLEECDLPDIRFHDLRHTYATQMIENNVPLTSVSHMLGHSSISITADVYCGVINANKEASYVADKLFFQNKAELASS